MPLLDLAYLSAAALGSPFLAYKALTDRKYRTGIPERLGRLAPREGDAPCVWVHAVSVGETNVIKPLVPAIAQRHPDWERVISNATYTGQDNARKLYPDVRAFYYPLDLSIAVRGAMDAIRPDLILLVELEIWPNFLAAARRRNVPVAIINGRISERSYKRYRLVRPAARRMFAKVSLFCAQNEACAERAIALGMPRDRVLVTGNMKFDACPASAPDGRDADLAASFGLSPDEALLVAGCTWPGEDEAIIPIYQRLKQRHPRLRLLLAPRQADRFGPVARLVADAGLPCVRRTAMADGTSGDGAGADDAVIVLDTMGELAGVYALADVVFVGGSLNRHGGHNILEPSGFAKPVLFGPHTANFRDITEAMLAHGAALRVDSAEALEAALTDLLASPEAATNLGMRARQVVDRNRGAARRTLEALEPFFGRSHQKGSHNP